MTQPGRIPLSDTGGLAKPSGALPGQAKGGESRDFHTAAFLDADCVLRASQALTRSTLSLSVTSVLKLF